MAPYRTPPPRPRTYERAEAAVFALGLCLAAAIASGGGLPWLPVVVVVIVATVSLSRLIRHCNPRRND